MTIGNVDSFERGARSAIRRHWVLFLIPGVVMVIFGLLAAAAPLIATPVIETFAGWLFLTGGFIGLAALFTTRNVPGFVWTLISAVLAILIGAFLVWRPLAGLVTLTIALAVFFAVHGVVQILTSLAHPCSHARGPGWRSAASPIWSLPESSSLAGRGVRPGLSACSSASVSSCPAWRW